MNKISKTKAYLKLKYDQSPHLNAHPFEKMYRYEHTLRVASWAERIALAENLDLDALVVGCLLHDISYIEPMPNEEARLNHGRRSAEICAEFLSELGFDEDIEKDILHGISAHVDGKGIEGWEDTLISDSISDADNLDRFDAYRIYEALEFAKYSQMTLEEKTEFCLKKMDGIEKYMEYEMATRYATLQFREMLKFMHSFYSKLHLQCSNSI